MATRTMTRWRASRLAFALAAATAIAMLVVSETSYLRAAAALEELHDRGALRSAIFGLRRGLGDAEAGQRGYLLTGRPEYLAPYQRSLGDVSSALDVLRRGALAPAAGRARVALLGELVDQKLSELGTTLQLFDAGRGEAWRGVLLSDIGREKMEALRSVTDELLDTESSRVEDARAGLQQTLLLGRFGVAALSLLSLLALALYLRQSAALERQRVERQRDIQNQRDQLEVEVAQRTDQLTQLTRHLQTVREDERRHLARELHDELGALLTAAKLDLARIKSRLGEASPDMAERLHHLADALNAGIALKRRIIEDLCPSSLSNLGLTAALEIALREFAERAEVGVQRRLEPVPLSASGALTVYRLVQEALTNIGKYARASSVEVTLQMQGEQVEVTVSDNGVGFDPARSPRSAHGLLGMRYRIEAEGGRMQLSSTPGRGTRIHATLPGSAPGAGTAVDAAALLPH